MLPAILALAFASVFLLVLGAAPPKEAVAGAFTAEYLLNKKEYLLKTSPLYRLAHPLIAFFALYARPVGLQEYKARLKKKLIRAGNPGGFTADDFLGVCLLCGVAFFAVGAYFSLAMGEFNVFTGIPFGLFGVYFPTLWLLQQIDRRMLEINRALPYVLDILTLSMEAGLDFPSAVDRMVSRNPRQDALYEEMFLMRQEMNIGKTRREALTGMAERCGVENLNTVVTALVQGEQLGTPLGQVLRVQSETIRLKRSQTAEKRAGEAPVKIIFPLLFIFMAVFLTLFGSIIIRAITGKLM